ATEEASFGRDEVLDREDDPPVLGGDRQIGVNSGSPFARQLRDPGVVRRRDARQVIERRRQQQPQSEGERGNSRDPPCFLSRTRLTIVPRSILALWRLRLRRNASVAPSPPPAPLRLRLRSNDPVALSPRLCLQSSDER